MSNKTLIGLHWLSIIWIIVILILASVSLYQTNEAKKNDDPTEHLNQLRGLNIASVVLVVVLLIPLLWWIYKQSKIGFSSSIVEVVF